jgi:hypothetical protein
MEISFIPSLDVAAVLNSLLDSFERRKTPGGRVIKVVLTDLSLPGYFSQIDPASRITANEQFIALEKAQALKLTWLPGETGHLLQSAALNPEQTAHVYQLLDRQAKTQQQQTLESLLLAEKFRYTGDWRAGALLRVLENIRVGKSPAPFSLTDLSLDADLLAVMAACSPLQTEIPYRIFSVQVFNDSKRLEAIRSQLVSLARLGNAEWKRLAAEEILRELNLVPNPTYIPIAGNWELVVNNGKVLNLGGFTPSVGFPAAQASQLLSVSVHADVVLCIENLTSFYEWVRLCEADGPKYAVLCTLGNPSPAVRRILGLLPDNFPIYHWSDIDYGGFNILSQLRRQVSERVQPYWMDEATLDANYNRSRPLTIADKTNLKKLLHRPELEDVRVVIEYLLKRGVRLEQEGISVSGRKSGD